MSERSNKQSRREMIRQRRKRQQNNSRLIIAGAAILVVSVLALLARNIVRPGAGVEAEGIDVEIMDDIGHIEVGTLVEYSTNPPTSGPHYVQPFVAGFFDETSPEIAIPNIEGYIVHNLEHGYVVIWYNCTVLSSAGCDQLKTDIQAAIVEAGAQKVIAFPWPSIPEPVVLTSWGQMLRMDSFDVDAAVNYIIANRSHPRSPEPFAD